ncbi:HAD family hydrolase [Candidatus Thorarchaeota archaeon]|jgi:HAD superfamily hydrolase (TIGR01450 family)|nr:MAG: HAD family hydrolase [Candidatus Thorarchaeota archaeon]
MSLAEKKLWVFDIDNTLIRDVEHPEVFPDAMQLWNALMKKDVTLAVLTNVGRLSARQVHSVIEGAGYSIETEHVFTAGAAAAAYVQNRKTKARCFVIGEGGAQEDFVARGLDVTNNPPVDYVAVAADRGMTFQELNFATKMVRDGAGLICISGSLDYPGVYLGHEDTFIGERSIVAAIEHATGVKAVVVGKPLPEILVETVRTLGFDVDDAVMVGDNPASDIAGGRAAGVATVLVKRPNNIVEFEPGDLDTSPDIEVESLEDLLEML